MTDVQKKAATAVLVLVILVVAYFLMRNLAPESDAASYSKEMSQQIPAAQTGANNPGSDPNAVIMQRGVPTPEAAPRTGSDIGK